MPGRWRRTFRGQSVPSCARFAMDDFLPRLINPPRAFGRADTRSRTDCFMAGYSFRSGHHERGRSRFVQPGGQTESLVGKHQIDELGFGHLLEILFELRDRTPPGSPPHISCSGGSTSRHCRKGGIETRYDQASKAGDLAQPNPGTGRNNALEITAFSTTSGALASSWTAICAPSESPTTIGLPTVCLGADQLRHFLGCQRHAERFDRRGCRRVRAGRARCSDNRARWPMTGCHIHNPAPPPCRKTMLGAFSGPEDWKASCADDLDIHSPK